MKAWAALDSVAVGGRRDPRWPEVIASFAAAAAAGYQAVFDTAVHLSRQLTGAEFAVVVQWRDGSAELLASGGGVRDLPVGRPPEGVSASEGRRLISVSVDSRTDLVVEEPAAIEFADGDLETVRTLAALIRTCGSGRGRDMVARAGASRVVASLDLEDVLVATADTVAQLLRAEIGGVLLRSGDSLEMRAMIGNTHPDSARLRIRAGHGLAGRVLVSGHAERLDDYSTDPRSDPDLMTQSDLEGTCAAIAVPLRWEGRVGGVLAAWRRRREPFTDEDESLLHALAELCAAAVRNAAEFAAQRARADRFENEADALRRRLVCADRDLRAYAELTAIASDDGEVDAVLRTVARLTSSAAALVTEDGRVLGHDSDSELVRDVHAAVTRVGDPGAAFPAARPGGGQLAVARVRAAGVTFGHLVLSSAEAPGPSELLAAEHAAVVCALLLAREDAAVSAAGRVESEFVWDLLEGRLPDSLEARVRARHLGTGFTLPARVVAVTVEGLAHRSSVTPWNAEHLERARARCARLISAAVEEITPAGCVLARRADLFAAIVPHPAELAPARLQGALAGIHWPSGMVAEIGIGGQVDSVADLPAGWRQAQLARSGAGSAGPRLFEELGVLQFLLAPTSRADLESFARNQLGPLLAYDAKRGSDLARTLEVHLSVGCSTRRTAELMCIHHRTVDYRLARIEKLTGMDLDDQEQRFRLQLACKIFALGGTEPD